MKEGAGKKAKGSSIEKGRGHGKRSSIGKGRGQGKRSSIGKGRREVVERKGKSDSEGETVSDESERT